MMTGRNGRATIGAMTATSHQTVTIGRGRHESPATGACVMELASMLAGEQFTDHPRAVCPVIAGFLRSYNDLMPDGQQDELYPYAALVVGSAASRRVRRERARRLLEWAGVGVSPGRLRLRLQTWDLIVAPAARAALRMDPQQRRVRVPRLLDDLVAIGRPAGEPIAGAAPAVPPSAERSGPGGARFKTRP
jgi:hypothetical protein